MAGQPDYVGEETQIGGGFGGMKPLAQHGRVVIADGSLTLYGTNGDVIDSAPLGQVEVKKRAVVMGQGVNVALSGNKYFISVGHGAAQLGPVAAPTAQMHQSITGTKGFIKAYEAITGKKV